MADYQHPSTELERIATLEAKMQSIQQDVDQISVCMADIREELATNSRNWFGAKWVLTMLMGEVTLVTGILGVIGWKLIN